MSVMSFDDMTWDEKQTPRTPSEQLKRLVVRATSYAHGEGDPIAVIEMISLMSSRPDLLVDGVYFIKCRIKAKDEHVTVISLGLLDQCMESQGFAFQELTMRMVLPRVVKLGSPGTATPSTVRHKASELVRNWGVLYGRDKRLEGYALAASEVAEKEAKEAALAQEISQRQQQQLHASSQSTQGSDRIGRSNSATSTMSASSLLHSNRNSRQLNLPSDGAPFQQNTSNPGTATPYDMQTAKEALNLLSSMMAQQEPVQARTDAALASVAMLCRKHQVWCVQQIAREESGDEQRVAQLLALNDELGNKLAGLLAMQGGGGGLRQSQQHQPLGLQQQSAELGGDTFSEYDSRPTQQRQLAGFQRAEELGGETLNLEFDEDESAGMRSASMDALLIGDGASEEEQLKLALEESLRLAEKQQRVGALRDNTSLLLGAAKR